MLNGVRGRWSEGEVGCGGVVERESVDPVW